MADLIIKYLPVDELIPYANNPRRNDAAVDKVAASIKEFGFRVPIVVDADNVIVAGHTRLKAAKKLGLKKVPCVIADDLTEDQIKAYRLADNKVSELAEWDFELLDIELDDIDLDMSQFGFELEDEADNEYSEEEEEDEWDDIESLERHYGVPYQGNKSRIADIIISILPRGKRLVDLFGGGGAITHCAMLSEKWESFLYNDINEMITRLFIDAVNGKYHDEKRIITREDFAELKDTDAYVKYIWSFGNNGQDYLWGKNIEEIKCQACRMLLADEPNERRLAYLRFMRLVSETRLSRPDIRALERLQALEHLQALQQLQALQRLEALQRLTISNLSYDEYEYEDGDIVYCDIPYEKENKGKCDDYGLQFDSRAFYEWAKTRPYQVFFSSYDISDKSFERIKVKEVCSLMRATTNAKKVTEYLYSNRPIER